MADVIPFPVMSEQELEAWREQMRINAEKAQKIARARGVKLHPKLEAKSNG